MLCQPVFSAALVHSPDLYVSGFFFSDVQRFYGPLSATPGAVHPAPGFSGDEYVAGVSRRPWGLAFGPDGNLFIANQQGGDGAIMRVKGPFDASPGAPAPAPGQTGSIFVPSSIGNYTVLAFGLDQNLYAGGTGAIKRFDAVTGASLGNFTSGPTLYAVWGLAFGPDQNLYASSFNSCSPGPTCTTTNSAILRFDGRTGAFIDTFVTNLRGGMEEPNGIGFGTNGDLFVCNYSLSSQTTEVLRFHGPLNASAGQAFPATGRTGAQFTSPSAPNTGSTLALAFGPDRTMYVSEGDNSGSGGVIKAYNGRTGVLLSTFATVSGGPRGLAFAIGAK